MEFCVLFSEEAKCFSDLCLYVNLQTLLRNVVMTLRDNISVHVYGYTCEQTKIIQWPKRECFEHNKP